MLLREVGSRVMGIGGAFIYAERSRVMGHHRKRTVRRTDGVTGGHIDPNVHNIDSNVAIVLIGSSVMRLIL